jgi:hypothetical protein
MRCMEFLQVLKTGRMLEASGVDLIRTEGDARCGIFSAARKAAELVY